MERRTLHPSVERGVGDGDVVSGGVRTGRETVKLGPPLTIPLDQMLTGIEILKETVNEVME